MHLVYLDESGNTGLNLNDPQQPMFCLCAMVVAEDQWQELESSLEAQLDSRFPLWRSTEGFEVHGADLRVGTGPFQGMSVTDRIAFRDAWMQAGSARGVRLMYRSVDKKRYSNWLIKEFGQAVRINPHVTAFALLSRNIDDYLKSLPGEARGMMISDENKEIVADVEKSIRVLRGLDGVLRLSRIVEKGFFIDSSKSLPLQLCDLYTLSVRKRAEVKANMAPARSFEASASEMVEKLLHVDDDQNRADVMAWIASNYGQTAQKRSGQGINPGSVDTGP